MLSFFQGKDNNTENNDITARVMGTLEPVLTENWPTIEPYADKVIAAIQVDENVKELARKVYPLLPMMVRMAVKEEKFVSLAVEHKAVLLTKLIEIKKKQNA
ncbi:hypothetical protein LLH06_14425 [Mucilaginibacter daejeonensis]|uniref:hypothetical protein n=1 Tax=Mucilaginibacter daejeonensis TaxID=398049 RepID=UPI001D179B33|nr:hypothetical protein [Mucilaginibacter daejeonensis]UEG52159.1 hypothetical protein LLH06_14425 [Mucilaginibacter daejeonensis]